MDHHGPSVWRVACLHTPQEGQNRSRVLWHPVIRPGHELELSHLSLLIRAVLQTQTFGGKVQMRKFLDSLAHERNLNVIIKTLRCQIDFRFYTCEWSHFANEVIAYNFTTVGFKPK